ncbi:FAD-dependent monooxygenase [Corynebacterium sp.]|jgi:2-polyprenyl-6-methoxyphenol hydroxylase-like FAD-dependent oxidoreductase|uniref:FAD-dependent monooxygenase n=1 Tax=Corynebacterium sp. TaxID=1720 RepID=UPI00345DBBB5
MNMGEPGTFDADGSCATVDVVVVGGGSVGMLAAAELTLQGLKVVLFEPRTDIDRRPRAGTVHARSLSHLARRGYIRSVAPREIAERAGQRHHAAFQFAGTAGLTLAAPAEEPAPLAGIPQAQLEETFEQRARAQGADIRRGTTVEAVTVDDDRGEVLVRFAATGLDAVSESGTVRARYCVGADGARSLVARSGNFPSVEVPATMNAISALARCVDGSVPAGWNPTDTGWTMHNPGFGGQGRVIGLDFSGPVSDRSAPGETEYAELMEHVLGSPSDLSQITHLTRFSDFARYRSQMRDGRLLVVGDAAHIHYPLGGQGLNTGMQDVFTLGWRLAAVIHGKEPERCLDDWSRTRVRTASVVVANTVLQSRMMHPDATALRAAVQSLLTVPGIHDGIADLISGQFQPGFVTDLGIESRKGSELSLAQLLVPGSAVELRVSEDAPRVGVHDLKRVSVTGTIRPTPPWRSAYITPDGYLSESMT